MNEFRVCKVKGESLEKEGDGHTVLVLCGGGGQPREMGPTHHGVQGGRGTAASPQKYRHPTSVQ